MAGRSTTGVYLGAMGTQSKQLSGLRMTVSQTEGNPIVEGSSWLRRASEGARGGRGSYSRGAVYMGAELAI